MVRKYGSNEEALEITKEAMWLAWKASQIVGMGIFQDNPTATKDDIVRVTHRGNEVHADYVFGRMMKTRFRVRDGVLSSNDYPPRPDYQSWALNYPTFEALLDAAEEVVLRQDNAEAK